MIKIEAYHPENIKGFYERLISKQANGVKFEYEIRVDNDQIVPRSENLSEFFAFESFLMDQTQYIEIFVYKGSSNRYDKFVFEMEKAPSMEATIQARLAEELKKMQLEWEFKTLNTELKNAKEKIKDLKETSKKQKNRIQELEADSKNSGMMHDMLGLLKQSNFMDKVSGDKDASSFSLNGIPQKALLESLAQIQKDLGDETFQTFLGTALMLGKNPELIPQVRNLIQQSIQ